MITIDLIQNEDFENIKSILISNRSEVDTPLDEEGGTCLHYAAWGNYIELANFLISELNDDVNKKDSEKSTPLHAAAHGSYEVAEMLIKKGADVNSIDTEGNTPMHYAIFRRQVDIVKLLLSFGAEADIKANDGKSALDMAEEQDDEMMINMFREKN